MSARVRVTWKESDHPRHPKGTSQGGQFAMKGGQSVVRVRLKGGPGSGNFGHAGRPGRVGGSATGSAQPNTGNTAIENAAKIEGAFNQVVGKDWSKASEAERAVVKDQIVGAVAELSGESYDTVNTIIEQWAHSSSGQDMGSLAIQRDAALEFKKPLSDYIKRGFARIKAGYVSLGNDTPLYDQKTQRNVLRAEYEHTQNFLRDLGIGPNDYVTLWRGTTSNQSKETSKGDIVNFHGNTLESWSFSRDVAEDFLFRAWGDNPTLIRTDVRAKDIFSTALTGIGCLSEAEVVTLGIEGMVEVVRILD